MSISDLGMLFQFAVGHGCHSVEEHPKASGKLKQHPQI